MKYAPLVTLALAVAASAFPHQRAAGTPGFAKKNGEDAIALNNKFKGLKEGDACKAGENACIGTKFAQCVGGKFTSTPCAPGTICAALPLVNSPGTSITCTTQADVDRRIAATGAQGPTNCGGPGTGGSGTGGSGTGGSGTGGSGTGGSGTGGSDKPPSKDPKGAASGGGGGNNGGSNNGGGGGVDPQTSLTLDPAVICKGFQKDGQETPTPGQVPSLTSSNNFINFCVDKGVPLTDGKQIKTGSCNPAPIGLIPSTDNMPSAKFLFPKNNDVLNEGESFAIKLNVKKIQTGNFVNAQTNYFAAPQQLNGQGQVIGHSHVVVEKVNGFGDTTPTDPGTFVFFKGVNDPAVDGVLSATVDKGLPAGTYRLASIIAAANHQPVIVPVAQRGTLDDAIYFTVKAGGGKKP